MRSDSMGLFSELSAGGVIRDVHLYNVDVSGISGGGLVGTNSGGKVETSSLAGTVAGGRFVGGIVGANSGAIDGCNVNVEIAGGSQTGAVAGVNESTGMILNTSSTGAVRGEFAVGGISGDNFGTIVGSHSSADVSSPNGIVGGLVGGNLGVISACYVIGSATLGGPFDLDSFQVGGGDSWYWLILGGLAGINSESGSISDSFASGMVTAIDTEDRISFIHVRIGGLVGDNKSIVTKSFAAGTVMNATYKGTFNAVIGGLIGSNTGEIQDCFSVATVAGSDWPDDNCGLTCDFPSYRFGSQGTRAYAATFLHSSFRTRISLCFGNSVGLRLFLGSNPGMVLDQ